MAAGFSTLGIPRSRINWVCGLEQEVSLNKKKKAVNHSCYPDEVIERLARCLYPAILESFNNEEDQKAFAAWQAEQARCLAKENQDFPTGNALTSIHSFFQFGCVLRGAPFLLCTKYAANFEQNRDLSDSM